MAVQFTCQYCDKLLKVKDEYVGRQIKCPGCQYKITVPAQSEEKKYLIQKPDGAIGPIGFIDVADMVNKGNIRAGDLVSVFGSDRFKPVREFQEFAALSKLASQKATAVTAKKGMGLLIKLGLIFGVVMVFVIGKTWWTDNRAGAHQEEITVLLNKKTRDGLALARSAYDAMLKDFPNHTRTEDTKAAIDKAEADIIKTELSDFKKLKAKVNDLAAKARTAIQSNQFNAALGLIRDVKGFTRQVDRIVIMRQEKHAAVRKELKETPAILQEELSTRREQFLEEQMLKIDKLVWDGKLAEAKAIILPLVDLKGLTEQQVRLIKEKNQSLAGVLNTKRPNGGPKTPKGPVSTNLMDDLKAADSERRLKALKTIILTKRALKGEDLAIFEAKAGEFMEEAELFFPALDAILIVGDKDGEFFDRMFKGMQNFVIYEEAKDMKPPFSTLDAFAGNLVSYVDTHGDIDKSDFLEGLVGINFMARSVLKEIGQRFKAEDYPSLKNKIEKLIMAVKEDSIAKAGIEALGKMRSKDSLELLTKIANYTSCQKCSFGGKDTGKKYLFQPLFCARCREKQTYWTEDSIFHVTLQALRAVGSRSSVKILKKLEEREKSAGHVKLSAEIGTIIEEIQK